MIDQIRRDIQARLEELLGEIDKLRRVLAALTSRGSEPDDADRTAPVASSAAAGESAAKSPRASARRTPRTRKASVPPRPAAPKPASSAGAPASARNAQGATKAEVLAALEDGIAMTAGEIAAATGLGRATVSTTPLKARDVRRDREGRPWLPAQARDRCRRCRGERHPDGFGCRVERYRCLPDPSGPSPVGLV
jgi:hypothetical protein